MKTKGIQGEKLMPKETVYVFEYEHGTVVGSEYNEERNEEFYEIDLLYGDRITVPSSCCFKVFKKKNAQPINHDDIEFGDVYDFYREWELNGKKIRLRYDPIEMYYLGDRVKVSYDNKHDFEYFEAGDALNIDWEGYGVALDMIIEKWLRRLNGEIIPFSDYYLDPINRYLDRQ